MTSLALGVGQTIELNDGRKAVVRFLGSTAFAPGEWVGVELDEGTGKNDGSVKGDRYFECEPNHGMFLRAAGVSRIVSRPSTRPSSLAQVRPPSLDTSRAASALPSPTKSPTKIARTATPSTSQPPDPPATANTANPARRPLSTAAAKPRTTSNLSGPSSQSRRSSTVPSSVSSTTAQTPRTSTATAAPSSRLTHRPASARQPLAPPSTRQPISARQTPATRRVSSAQKPPPQHPPSPTRSPPLDAPDDNQDAQEPSEPAKSFAPPSKPPTSPAASHGSQRPTKTTAREVEDLQTKMKVMERKRQEDRDKLKKMQEIEQERDKYGSIVQKMQSKMQAQSQELNELRSQLKDSETRLVDIEAIQAEHDAVVEMATLDREMAEETAEVLKTEVDALRSKNEEMQLELDILNEENQELGREMNPEERTSQGWLQLERSNERLREALLRLRDMTQEQEADLKAQIASLEDEVKDFGTLKHDHEETREKLLATEADFDDVRQQLEAAMGADDMIEELTERNMTMQEKIDDLTLVIEDLENLRELNDELEVNHVEAEKQMQEEIDFKDTIIGEQSRRSVQQQQAIEDCEYTISRFRELVTSLQADLEDMRASRQITETEAEELSSRSRAMMDLNMKLQLSATKTQVKTIDLELRRLEAEEAAEHLAIVQLFLPETFLSERDSILALLRFKRVTFKSRLLSTLIKERVNGQGTKIADEDLFAAYSVLDRLTWVAEMGDRFVHSIRSCSVDDFSRYESALYELEPVERALNTSIESLKRDDMRESTVDEELQRSMAVMSHLASLHIKDSLAASAVNMLMQASLIQSHLDSTSSALGLCRSMVQRNITDSSNGHGNDAEEASLFAQLDTIISSVRGARVIVNKTHRNISDLLSRSLALNPSTTELLVNAESLTSRLAGFSRRAGEEAQALFGEEGREEPVGIGEAELLFTRLSANSFGNGSAESTPFASLSGYLDSLTIQLNELSGMSADLENTQEFELASEPWMARSAALRATKLTSADTEAEVARLTEVVRERSLLVRSKEQELEEQSVRIEMLEARMSDAQKRSSHLADLETTVQAFKKEESALRAAVEEAHKDVNRLRKDRDQWRSTAEERKPDAIASDDIATEMGGASRLELDRAQLRIDSLESAIRYLQSQDSKPIKSKTQDLAWLEAPLLKQRPRRYIRDQTLRAEGQSAFTELLKLVGDAKPVSLSNVPKNRLAWRPAAQTAKWAAYKKREDWTAWQDWEHDILSRATGTAKIRAIRSSAVDRDQMIGIDDAVRIVDAEVM